MPARMSDPQYYVLKYLTASKSNAQIAREIGVHSNTVGLWRNRNYPPSAAPMHPRKSKKLSIVQRRKLVVRLVEHVVKLQRTRYTAKKRLVRNSVVLRFPFQSTRRVARELAASHSIVCSAATVRNDLIACGKECKVARKCPPLSQKNIAARMSFCRWATRNTSLCKGFLFTDEKMFDVNSHLHRTFWVAKGSQPPQASCGQAPASVMAYGVIGVGFRYIAVEDRTTYNAIKFNEEILAKAVPSLRAHCKATGARYMQDNAPCHAKAAAYLTRRSVQQIPVDWPGQSCDLNPIERLWSILARRVSSQGPSGTDELKAFIADEFHKIEQETIDRLCLSFVPTCRKVIFAKGLTVKP